MPGSSVRIIAIRSNNCSTFSTLAFIDAVDFPKQCSEIEPSPDRCSRYRSIAHLSSLFSFTFIEVPEKPLICLAKAKPLEVTTPSCTANGQKCFRKLLRQWVWGWFGNLFSVEIRHRSAKNATAACRRDFTVPSGILRISLICLYGNW